MKVSIWIRVLPVILMIISAGCGQTPEAVEAEVLLDEVEAKIDYSSAQGLHVEPGEQIAIVLEDTRSAFGQAMIAGAQMAVEALNEAMGYEGADAVTLLYEAAASDLDVDGQINTVDAVLSEYPSALLLASVDVDSCEAQMETARENQIPVILVESGINTELSGPSCMTDHTQAAREAAAEMAAAMDDGGRLLLLVHNPRSQASQEREAGFIKALREEGPGVELAAILYEQEEVDLVEQVRDLVEQDSSISGIFSTSEKMTQIALEASENLNRDLLVAGFGGTAAQMKAVEEGRAAGIMGENPSAMGYAGVVAAVRELLGMANDPVIYTGNKWITKDNLYDEEIQKYIYE